MSKEDILTVLKGLDIPSDSYIVTMGAVLAVHERREAGDIDIIFDPRVEPLLKERGFAYSPKSAIPEYKTRYVRGSIEAFTCFFNIGTYRECVTRYAREFIDGIPFMSLKDTLQVKARFGREKDLHDCACV